MNRPMACTVLLALLLYSPASLAGWHSTGQVTRVTVLQGSIYVAGAAPSGYECTNYAAFYGTLYSPSTDPAHKQYQALALSAYLTGKALSCHVYHRDQSGTCRMDNCHIQ